jgi:tetratricopeptide (TPR) repeat protein
MSSTVAEADPGLPPADGLPKIPGYQLTRLLGRGGMGCVYLARDVRLSREVAVKTLAVDDPDLAARFQEEVTAVAAVRHPNVLHVYQAGEFDGRPYCVMEYVAGGTLSAELAGKPMAPRAAAALLEPVARAVHHCHGLGILHRDLKPGNILLASAGCGGRSAELETLPGHVGTKVDHSALRPPHAALIPKVADFGLAKRLYADAKLTRTGEVLGTPAYMAPEQASGVVTRLGPAADIYALGAILYEMLTGRPPFQSPDPVQTLMMVLSMDPIPPRQLQPAIPRDLDTICLRCLQKSPKRRYASAADLADDLGRFLDGRPIAARPIRAWEKAVKWTRRRPAAAGLIAVSVLAVVGGLIGGLAYNAKLRAANKDLTEERDRSEQLFRRGHELVRFLLADHTDALGRLKGSTAAQRQLVAELLPYLDHLASQLGGNERVAADITVPELARAYERLAGIQGFPGQPNLGDTAGARASYTKALELRQAYRAAHPGEAEAVAYEAACLSYLGSVEMAAGLRPEARGHFEEAIALAWTGDDTYDERQIAFTAAFSLAELTLVEGRQADGKAMLKDLLAAARITAAARPRDHLVAWNLAQLLARVGDLEAQAHNWADARKLYDEALKLADVLRRHRPDDVRYEHEFALTALGYGDLLFGDMKFEASLQPYSLGLQLLRRLATADPDSQSLRRDVIVALEKYGRALTQVSRSKEAIPLLEEALTGNRALLQLDPNHRGKRLGLRICLTTLGGAHGEAKAYGKAVEMFREVVDLARADNDLATLGEAEYFRGYYVKQQAWTLPPARKRADFQRAADHFDAAVAAMTELEKAGPLTPSQARLKAAFTSQRDLTRKALAALPDPEGKKP